MGAQIILATYDGKKIVFTVRGNYSNAKIEAILKYVEPPVPELTKVVFFAEDAAGHRSEVTLSA